MDTAQERLAAGNAALQRADWSTAQAEFELAIRSSDSPEARDGLGLALWWLNEIDAAHRQRALAYSGYKERGEWGAAARLACWLGREQVFLHGNIAAMQGWFARAARLIELVPPGIDQAWFHILRASMIAPPAEMAQIAEQTITAARRWQHSELEAFALAFGGQAQIALGWVERGLQQLDEAMTMVTSGEVRDFTIISEVFCALLSACETAGDLVRSEQWCRAAADFAEYHHCSFLSAYCRTTYGSLMTALGRWSDAEQALTEAIRAFEQGHKWLRIHAVIRLAGLRVAQDRIEEAEIMLAGLEDYGNAVVPIARLHLRKGEAAFARAVLEQALTEREALTLHQREALLTLIEVLLALDDVAAADAALQRLVDLTQHAQSHMLTAQIELTRGSIQLRQGAVDAAQASFARALATLKAYDQSMLAGQVRLKMALSLQTSDPAGAIVWARAALATFDRLGVPYDRAEAVKLLRTLGAPTQSAPRSRKPLTEREIEIVGLLASGLTNREIAERLVISAKTVEHHVSSILNKLNLRSRTEAAALLASGKLDDLISS
jgi:DNA-binding NarL/FixJ family response regulator